MKFFKRNRFGPLWIGEKINKSQVKWAHLKFQPDLVSMSLDPPTDELLLSAATCNFNPIYSFCLLTKILLQTLTSHTKYIESEVLYFNFNPLLLSFAVHIKSTLLYSTPRLS